MIAPLSPAELDRLRDVVRERWPACAEAQGVTGVDIRLQYGVRFVGAWLLASEDGDAVERAKEGLARILEDAGYEVRRDGAHVVTGWATVICSGPHSPMGRCTWCHGSGRVRIIDIEARDIGDRRAVAYHTGLSLGRAARDRARLEGIGANGPYEHAARVNEMAMRSKQP